MFKEKYQYGDNSLCYYVHTLQHNVHKIPRYNFGRYLEEVLGQREKGAKMSFEEHEDESDDQTCGCSDVRSRSLDDQRFR